MHLCQQIENQNALSDHCMGDGTENLAAEKKIWHLCKEHVQVIFHSKNQGL